MYCAVFYMSASIVPAYAAENLVNEKVPVSDTRSENVWSRPAVENIGKKSPTGRLRNFPIPDMVPGISVAGWPVPGIWVCVTGQSFLVTLHIMIG